MNAFAERRSAFFDRLASATPLIMGILNVTPDSFSDGGRFNTVETGLQQAMLMLEEGADILDIGGESTRPGSAPVSAEDELARVSGIIQTIAKARPDTLISIDSYKAAIAAHALEHGATLINDVWGLQKDPDMARVMADYQAPAIIMHNRTEVDERIDIMDDIKRFLSRSIELALKAGNPESHLILDPGIGFGKSLDQNIEIINGLSALKSFGLPILMGLSRKRFIGAALETEVGDRVIGSIICNLKSIEQGADIIRVHDVQAHAQAIKMTKALTMQSPLMQKEQDA